MITHHSGGTMTAIIHARPRKRLVSLGVRRQPYQVGYGSRAHTEYHEFEVLCEEGTFNTFFRFKDNPGVLIEAVPNNTRDTVEVITVPAKTKEEAFPDRYNGGRNDQVVEITMPIPTTWVGAGGDQRKPLIERPSW